MAAKGSKRTSGEEAPAARTWVLISGVALLATGAFATVSAFGYHPDDPNWILENYTAGAAVRNPCGAVGAFLAYHLVSTYGLAGYVLPLLLFFWGFHVLVRRRLEGAWRKLAGGLLLVAALSTLFGALSARAGWLYRAVEWMNIPTPGEFPPRAGGLLGFLTTALLGDWFGPVGIYLIVSGVALLSLVLLAERSLEWALSAVGRAFKGLLGALGRRLGRPAAEGGRKDEESPGRRGRSRKDGPSVRAVFGQAEEEMRRARAAAEAGAVLSDAAPQAPRAAARPSGPEGTGSGEGPVIKIAHVTEPSPQPEPEEERDAREKRQIAALDARAAGEAAPRAAAQPAPPLSRKRPAPSGGGPRGPRSPRERAPAEAARPKPSPADYRDYKLPALGLLDEVEYQAQVTNEVLTRRGQVLTDTLKEFRIETRLASIDRGPAVTIYELELAAGIRVQRVMELADNLAMGMRAPNVRIIAPIPGKDTIGVEVPNTEREVVRLRPILESKVFKTRTKNMAVPFVIGRDAAGEVLVEDLTRMPHLLVAGATGSGKSVCLNSFISTVLMHRSPGEVRLLLVDPKMVEMSQYKGIPHLITPVITDMKRAAGVFEWATRKMDERYEMLSATGCRDINRYNRCPAAERLARAEAGDVDDLERFGQDMPYIVVIIDELADLMMLASKEIERSITRLAQKSRGVGIHIILATQRPSVDVVTGLIKTNMPARIAFQVSSKVDSRTIIDQNGAEKLMGSGDMLYLPPTTSRLVRAKGTYVSDEEVARIAAHVRGQAAPAFVAELEAARSGSAGGTTMGDLEDELFEEAVRVVLETRRGSVSLLQRRLGVGYTRAAKLIDMMADRGILGPYRGSKPRKVLVSLESWEAGRLGEGAAADEEVAGQLADERPPQGVPAPADYQEAEDESEAEGHTAASASGRSLA